MRRALNARLVGGRRAFQARRPARLKASPYVRHVYPTQSTSPTVSAVLRLAVILSHEDERLAQKPGQGTDRAPRTKDRGRRVHNRIRRALNAISIWVARAFQ